MTPHERMGRVYRETRELDPSGRLGDLLWLAGYGDGHADEAPDVRATRMERLWREAQRVWRSREAA